MFSAVSYFRSRDGDPGLTTEAALLAAPLLCALAMSNTLLAYGLAVAVAVVLAVKTPVHKFVKTVLTNGEFNDFGIATLKAFSVTTEEVPTPETTTATQ